MRHVKGSTSRAVRMRGQFPDTLSAEECGPKRCRTLRNSATRDWQRIQSDEELDYVQVHRVAFTRLAFPEFRALALCFSTELKPLAFTVGAVMVMVTAAETP